MTTLLRTTFSRLFIILQLIVGPIMSFSLAPSRTSNVCLGPQMSNQENFFFAVGNSFFKSAKNVFFLQVDSHRITKKCQPLADLLINRLQHPLLLYEGLISAVNGFKTFRTSYFTDSERNLCHANQAELAALESIPLDSHQFTENYLCVEQLNSNKIEPRLSLY